MIALAASPDLPTALEDALPLPVVIAKARLAQREWSRLPLNARLDRLRSMRHAIADSGVPLAEVLIAPSRTIGQKLISEVLPVADAIRFLERRADRILRPVRYGRQGCPIWLGRTHLEVRREPLGVILIIAPSNYPLFLPGVQIVQALAAGNAVLVKPAPGHSGVIEMFRKLGIAAGIPEALWVTLPEEIESVSAAIDAGINRVVFTGSMRSGSSVLKMLAPHTIPATMELSGCDAVFVCDDADLEVVARSLQFGITLNGAQTCIAPRRVFVSESRQSELAQKLRGLLASAGEVVLPVPAMSRVRSAVQDALADGARIACGDLPSKVNSMKPLVLADARPEMAILREDLFGPVLSLVPVKDMQHALGNYELCPYRLGAVVFGSGALAAELTRDIDAGQIVVNDILAATADPRLPFGGRGSSGFGVTRGAEGLLEMTQVKAISTRRGRFRPHLDPPHPLDLELFSAYLAAAHGRSTGGRLKAIASVVRTLVRRGRASGIS